MNLSEKAVDCFRSGFNCSQAILSTYCESMDLDKEIALKLACPFGAGMGRMSGTCGAVTGAYMLIGLKYGKYLPEDNEAKEKSYALVNEFNERFKQLHGTISCRELLLNKDMRNSEDMQYIKEHDLWAKLCPNFIRDSAQLVEDLLEL